MLPFRVLAIYKPSTWTARIVGRELTDLTAKLGYTPHDDPVHGPLSLKGRNWSSVLLHAEVRRRTFATTQAEGWHYDADLSPGGNPNCLICLWASNTPTLIRWKHSPEIFQPRPYEVVLFNNMHCEHKRPSNCPKVRWVFRQRLAVKELAA